MTIDQLVLGVVTVGFVWLSGRMSSYGGWIRRVERQGQEAVSGLRKEIEARDAAILEKVEALVRAELATFQANLPETIGVGVVQRLGEALSEAKGNEQLVAIGNLLKTKR